MYNKSNPRFYKAPSLFCKTKFSAITLPPFGVFLCPKTWNNIETRAHELVHWDQYKRCGALKFYLRYIKGFITSGLSYEKNPMEIEARKRAGEFMDLAQEIA